MWGPLILPQGKIRKAEYMREYMKDYMRRRRDLTESPGLNSLSRDLTKEGLNKQGDLTDSKGLNKDPVKPEDSLNKTDYKPSSWWIRRTWGHGSNRRKLI